MHSAVNLTIMVQVILIHLARSIECVLISQSDSRFELAFSSHSIIQNLDASGESTLNTLSILSKLIRLEKSAPEFALGKRFNIA